MNGWKKAALIALVACAAGIGGTFLAMASGLSKGTNVTITGIDLSDMPDGSYTGTYTNGRWTNTLIVQVKERAITGIDIDKDVTFALADCSDEIFRRVMEAQDTGIDAVSGATVTSKAYLKAIENALCP